MTQKRLYELAYHGALEIWDRERRYVEELPGNPYTAAKEQKAWEEVEEIKEELLRLEKEA